MVSTDSQHRYLREQGPGQFPSEAPAPSLVSYVGKIPDKDS